MNDPWIVADTASEPFRWRLTRKKSDPAPRVEDFFSHRPDAYLEASKRNNAEASEALSGSLYNQVKRALAEGHDVRQVSAAFGVSQHLIARVKALRLGEAYGMGPERFSKQVLTAGAGSGNLSA